MKCKGFLCGEHLREKCYLLMDSLGISSIIQYRYIYFFIWIEFLVQWILTYYFLVLRQMSVTSDASVQLQDLSTPKGIALLVQRTRRPSLFRQLFEHSQIHTIDQSVSPSIAFHKNSCMKFIKNGLTLILKNNTEPCFDANIISLL